MRWQTIKNDGYYFFKAPEIKPDPLIVIIHSHEKLWRLRFVIWIWQSQQILRKNLHPQIRLPTGHMIMAAKPGKRTRTRCIRPISRMVETLRKDGRLKSNRCILPIKRVEHGSVDNFANLSNLIIIIPCATLLKFRGQLVALFISISFGKPWNKFLLSC